MNLKEKSTDLWVYDLLKEAELNLDAQGSTIKEIDDALKTASKRGTGKVGFPEYVGIVKDFIIVIEDKSSLSMHEKRTDDGIIAEDVFSICDYAVNGALFYGKHLIKKTSYTKVIAIGASGNEKKHRISPLFINDRLDYYELPEIETFISFNDHNIYEYYTKEILKENTNFEKETKEILKDAALLHEDLRNYGSIQDKDKPLIVSGILLALREIEYGNFSIDMLTGDSNKTDGEKIYDAIRDNLNRARVSPDVKRDKLLNQFSVIKDTTKINQIEPNLGKTPNKHYTEFLYKSIYQSIRYHQSGEDYLGRFYGEFMSYSGGDGQALGIILTPRHITELFCDLLDLKPSDTVMDPCCGKSTIFKILQKQEIATDGEVQLNNKNILDITDSTYYSKIGFATQDTGIFTASIKDNISLFDNRSVDKTIIEQLGLNTLINSKPKGIDTVISSEDKSISGGEKQRIAIARLLNENFDCILLDESTSSLDKNSVDIVEECILSKKDLTVIAITHHLTSKAIEMSDFILKLEDGKLVPVTM